VRFTPLKTPPADYASDWAYDVVEQIWPEAINFVGADEIPDSAQMGEYGMVTATVADLAAPNSVPVFECNYLPILEPNSI
jgi:hypothetical protein